MNTHTFLLRVNKKTKSSTFSWLLTLIQPSRKRVIGRSTLRFPQTVVPIHTAKETKDTKPDEPKDPFGSPSGYHYRKYLPFGDLNIQNPMSPYKQKENFAFFITNSPTKQTDLLKLNKGTPKTLELRFYFYFLFWILIHWKYRKEKKNKLLFVETQYRDFYWAKIDFMCMW